MIELQLLKKELDSWLDGGGAVESNIILQLIEPELAQQGAKYGWGESVPTPVRAANDAEEARSVAKQRCQDNVWEMVRNIVQQHRLVALDKLGTPKFPSTKGLKEKIRMAAMQSVDELAAVGCGELFVRGLQQAIDEQLAKGETVASKEVLVAQVVKYFQTAADELCQGICLEFIRLRFAEVHTSYLEKLPKTPAEVAEIKKRANIALGTPAEMAAFRRERQEAYVNLVQDCYPDPREDWYVQELREEAKQLLKVLRVVVSKQLDHNFGFNDDLIRYLRRIPENDLARMIAKVEALFNYLQGESNWIRSWIERPKKLKQEGEKLDSAELETWLDNPLLVTSLSHQYDALSAEMQLRMSELSDLPYFDQVQTVIELVEAAKDLKNCRFDQQLPIRKALEQHLPVDVQAGREFLRVLQESNKLEDIVSIAQKFKQFSTGRAKRNQQTEVVPQSGADPARELRTLHRQSYALARQQLQRLYPAEHPYNSDRQFYHIEKDGLELYRRYQLWIDELLRMAANSFSETMPANLHALSDAHQSLRQSFHQLRRALDPVPRRLLAQCDQPKPTIQHYRQRLVAGLRPSQKARACAQKKGLTLAERKAIEKNVLGSIQEVAEGAAGVTRGNAGIKENSGEDQPPIYSRPPAPATDIYLELTAATLTTPLLPAARRRARRFKLFIIGHAAAALLPLSGYLLAQAVGADPWRTCVVVLVTPAGYLWVVSCATRWQPSTQKEKSTWCLLVIGQLVMVSAMLVYLFYQANAQAGLEPMTKPSTGNKLELNSLGTIGNLG